MANTVLIVQTSLPFQNHSGQEALDMALSLANFELPVKLLFTDNGVWHFNAGMSPSEMALKDFTKTYPALQFYDIDDIFVCGNSLKSAGLSVGSLPDFAQCISTDEIKSLFQSVQQVVTF